MQPIAFLQYPVILYDEEKTSQTESISSLLIRWRKKFVTNPGQRRTLTTHPGPIVLPPGPPDNRFVDLIFRTAILEALHVRFAVSTQNCIAFSLNGVEWHEVLVNRGRSPIMHDSTLVPGFTSTHISLKPWDRDVTKTSLIYSVNLLGQYIHIHDANELKGKGEEKFVQVETSSLERAFGVIAAIFCHGARFRCIAGFVAENFEDSPSYKLGDWAGQWITNWLQISWILQAVDHFNKTGLFPRRYATSDQFIQDMESQIRDMSLTIPGRGSLETVEEVRFQLAMLKHHNTDD